MKVYLTITAIIFIETLKFPIRLILIIIWESNQYLTNNIIIEFKKNHRYYRFRILFNSHELKRLITLYSETR